MVGNCEKILEDLPFDLFMRNFIITQIVDQIRNQKKLKILDVGGRNGSLKFENDDYVILDIRTIDNDIEKNCYFQGNAKCIPFKDESFDIVISSDLYEHIPQQDRKIALDEMLRVSKKFIILGAPFYSPEIEKSEIILNDYYLKLNGEDHPWLKEHIEIGLPDIEEFESILLGKKCSFQKIGSNHLSIWFKILMLIIYASRHEVPLDYLKKIYTFYNKHCFELGDSLEPTYRKIYAIQKFGIIENINVISRRSVIDTQKLRQLEVLIFDAIRSSAEKKDNHIRYLDFEKSRDTRDIQQKNEIIALTQNENKRINENNASLLTQNNLVLQSLNEILEQNKSLQQSLNESRNDIDILSHQIYEIKNSITWTLLTKFHSGLVVKLLPPTSKRNNIYTLGIKSGKILISDGFFSLIQEYKKRRSFLKSQNDLDMPHKCKVSECETQQNNNGGIFPVYKNDADKPVSPHKLNADIIICIHNAYNDVKLCLESVVKYTTPPFSLILIDDGSKELTQKYVENFVKIHNNTQLVHNNTARGYTYAANQGLKISSAPYVILLNSDTIVTYEWLDRIIECADSDDKIGIVGPLSNTASWQSVPNIDENGDWAKNALPSEISIQQMGRLIAKYSSRTFPKIPFINGFCLLIKRKLIDDIGYFDEHNFGRGYGEENDYCLRALKAEWIFAVADDVYIFHSQSRSYSDEKRKQLCEHSDKILHQKHGSNIIINGVMACKNNKILMGIRARTRTLFDRQQLLLKGRNQFESKRILIILPVCNQGGGSYVVTQESKSIMDMGVDIRLFNLISHRPFFEKNFPGLDIPVIYGNIEDLDKISDNFDAIICTTNESVAWVEHISNKKITAYYIQDYEPDFYPSNSTDYNRALQSYSMIPDMIKFSKTRWVYDIVKEKTGIECNIIGPSVDIDLFRPLSQSEYHPNGTIKPVHIIAMIRPSTPRRNPQLTLELLREIKLEYQEKVFIQTFGCSIDELSSIRINHDFSFCHVGIISRDELVSLFNNADIFLDCSSFQAMGLTAFEAMACGVAVIVPKNGGCNDVIKSGVNGLIVDTQSKSCCLDALKQLVLDNEFRRNLSLQAITDVCEFFPERAAYNILNTIFGERN